MVRESCFTKRVRKKEPATTKVPAKRGRPAKKKVEPVKEPEPEIEIIFEDDKLEHLRRFCKYAGMFYIPYFLTANIGADAAITDLSLFKKLSKFSQVDKELADEGLATLSRHLWYLAPNTVLLSLASEKLGDDDKSRIATRLLSLPKPKKSHMGLPTFPKLTEKTELWDLVTSDSWELFDLLGLSADWLALPPTDWDASADYVEFRNFVRTLKVTNDCAERGVKLATDFSKSLTKDSQERSKIYQVVEAERRAKPDTKKSTLNK